MLKSMTGYGKAECVCDGLKYTVEIRSLNGKNADVSLKSALIPKDKEIQTRQHITSVLGRGNIDVFITQDKNASEPSGKNIDRNMFAFYLNQIREIVKANSISGMSETDIVGSILRLPDVIDTTKEELSEEGWNAMSEAIKKACEEVDAFRTKEGGILEKDLRHRVSLIQSFVSEVEKFEASRIDTIRQRIMARMEEMKIEVDQNRLEQEIIYYLEKLDITEEKVRLRQHCSYFLETIDTAEMPGKKLGFIAQEMGREINTMGSKSNQADMQQWVVKMKDELEKIKEQSLNIL